jgi:uncharacterized protein YceK
MLAIMVISLTGCGTLCSTSGVSPVGWGERPYGGVRLDVAAVMRDRDCPEPETLGRIKQWAAWTCFLAVDVPLSAVADTLLLPVQIWTDWHARAWLQEITSSGKHSDGKETEDSPDENAPKN